MENQKNSYSVSEIATLLDVPRTTINDWLARYNRFLETENRGKRKVYTNKALDILKDVSKLRNDGFQVIDIERFLEEKHGMHPEIENSKMTDNMTDEIANDGQISNQNSTLEIAVNNNNEMELLVKNQFEELAYRFEKLSQERNNIVKKSTSVIIILVLFLLILFAAGAYYSLKMFENLKNSAELNQKNNQQTQSQLLNRLSDNNSKLDQISGNNENKLNDLVVKLNIQNEELKNELKKQQGELKLLIEESKKVTLKSYELENIKAREEFAAKQSELLKQLVQKEEEIKKLNQVIQTQNQIKIDEMKTQIKPVIDEKVEIKVEENPPVVENIQPTVQL